MARKKKSKRGSKSGGLLAWFTAEKKPKRRSAKPQPVDWKHRLAITGVIFGWIALGGGLCVGFYYMQRYINQKREVNEPKGKLELINAPSWLTSQWLQEITLVVGGNEFTLDESIAAMIGSRLESLSWMHDVKINTVPDKIQVRATYRRPAVKVKIRSNQWVYLDQGLVVTDYIPVTAFPVVELRGISARDLPLPGEAYRSDSAQAAVTLVELLEKMDQKRFPDKPLLGEIEWIDVSNYGGRRSASRPHLILKAVDGTEVYWGAAFGQSARFLEAGEAEKVTKLYEFYEQNGKTILGKVKYIELRTPQIQLPRPQ